jgi:hypothetical protein
MTDAVNRHLNQADALESRRSPVDTNALASGNLPLGRLLSLGRAASLLNTTADGLVPLDWTVIRC